MIYIYFNWIKEDLSRIRQSLVSRGIYYLCDIIRRVIFSYTVFNTSRLMALDLAFIFSASL